MLQAILVYNSGYVCQVDTTHWKCEYPAQCNILTTPELPL